MNEAENQNLEEKEGLSTENHPVEEPKDEVVSGEENMPIGEKQDGSPQIEVELAEAKDKYLRLYADFENFRRRTAKERLDLISNANEDLLKSLLTIIDDFERASKSMDSTQDVQSIKEGIHLIYAKFLKNLENKGLRVMPSSIGQLFDLEKHESITQIPAPDEDMKGKVIDEVEKGYYLNDKIIRFAKVVIGS